MATFDAQIEQVAEYVGKLRAAGQSVREFNCPTAAADLTGGLPVRVGPGANPGIILRGDTFVELGNPSTGSCAFVLWTKDPSLVADGKITLVGPDVKESAGASLPFAQIVLVGGEELDAAAHPSLTQAQYVADQIEGYMVRSSSQNIWSRVSKDAEAKGFSFETLGRALTSLFKSSVPGVRTMEVLFVTSGKEDVQGLESIAAQVRETGKELVNEHWKSKGYDLSCDLDCSSCHDKDVCDDIRKVIVARKRKETGSEADKAAVEPVS